MFSTNSSKICCSFAKNKIFEKSKMAAIYFALYQNLKLSLVNLYWKTLETELKWF